MHRIAHVFWCFFLVAISFAPADPSQVKVQAKLNLIKPGTKTQLEPQAADVSGYYTCKGMEVGGKSYSGMVAISRKGDVYVVQWMLGAGSTFTGIGIRQNDVLATSWALPNQQGMIVKGINMYRIETAPGGPRLTGRWTSMPGPGVLQSETLTFLKAMDEEE